MRRRVFERSLTGRLQNDIGVWAGSRWAIIVILERKTAARECCTHALNRQRAVPRVPLPRPCRILLPIPLSRRFSGPPPPAPARSFSLDESHRTFRRFWQDDEYAGGRNSFELYKHVSPLRCTCANPQWLG